MSDHVVPLKVYYTIFVTLLVLTAVTVWVAYIDLGAMSTVVALGIASFKASLVILYFMHVRYGSHLTWLFVGSGFLWLVILLVLLLADYVSRPWQYQAVPWMT